MASVFSVLEMYLFELPLSDLSTETSLYRCYLLKTAWKLDAREKKFLKKTDTLAG